MDIQLSPHFVKTFSILKNMVENDKIPVSHNTYGMVTLGSPKLKISSKDFFTDKPTFFVENFLKEMGVDLTNIPEKERMVKDVQSNGKFKTTNYSRCLKWIARAKLMGSSNKGAINFGYLRTVTDWVYRGLSSDEEYSKLWKISIK